MNQHTTDLQGTIFDAITGDRIGGSDMLIYLRQGALTREPDLFYTGERTNNDMDVELMGDYVFTSIPSMDTQSTTITDPNANEYYLTVIKDGYQRFDGIVDRDMLANRDSVVRNIYLYPEGYMLPCYNYTATFEGAPVEGVTIMAAPYATLNPGIIATDKWLSLDLTQVAEDAGLPFSLIGSVFNVFGLFNGNYFFPSPGYQPSIERTTDADGEAAFCPTDTEGVLAAGAAYAVCAYPTEEEFNGAQLYLSCKLLVAGFSDTDQVFELFDLNGTGNKYDLYVDAISNSVADQVDSTGTLEITFSRPVDLTVGTNSPKGFLATETSASGILDGTDPVTESLSADGMTLTLTPNWATAPTAGETGTAITYAPGDAFVSVQEREALPLNVFALEDTKGDVISGVVNLTTPSPTAVPLYITSISNSDGTLDANGELVINFSQPITLTGDFTAIETSVAGVLNANQVTETLSNGDKTLTLTPSWATPPGAGTGESITFSQAAAVVTVASDGTNVPNVFALTDIVNASTISATVDMN